MGANLIKTLIDRPNAIHTIPYYKWHLITSDMDDNKFVDCAIACGEDYIITEDHHFRDLNKTPFPKIVQIGLPKFRKILDERTK